MSEQAEKSAQSGPQLPELQWQPEQIPEEESSARRSFRLRHSTSHIMAEAVKRLFPEARLAIGPPIQNGFYYDFELDNPLTPEDLDRIASRMRKIIKRAARFERAELGKAEAIAYFEASDQPFKVDIIQRLEGDSVSVYRQNQLIDLCAGPHVQNTKACKHFKLLSVAGAHWRGQTDGPRLQRIYGTVWATAEQLEAYLTFLDEVKKRDHRRLGTELDLFSFHPWAPGAPFYHPKGVQLRKSLMDWTQEITKAAGYIEISNPVLYKKDLFETSGHWQHFHENMFTLEDADGEVYGLKPMNCPDTMLFFKSRRRSFKELPLRVSEHQLLHRNELSGALSGMTRVRQFAQDDGHIFLREDMVADEIADLLGLIERTYGLFDMNLEFAVSTRPEKAMGEPELWDSATESLKEALDKRGKSYAMDEGGGAFYGPKIDIQVSDSLGRQWQCATVQLDFNLPRSFGLVYTDTDNTLKTPLVIHRAIYGSFERFLGVLIEHLGGVFPTWLAPVQAVVLPIKDALNEYCYELEAFLREAGLRVHVDDRSEKLGYKIREAETQKVPYMLVVGQREADAREVSLRTYQEGERDNLSWEALRDELVRKTQERTFDVTLKELASWEDEPDAAADDDSAEY